MSIILLAIGSVLCFEGLVFALAPSYFEKMLDTLKNIPIDSRRMAGLGALSVGVFLVWLSQSLGA